MILPWRPAPFLSVLATGALGCGGGAPPSDATSAEGAKAAPVSAAPASSAPSMDSASSSRKGDAPPASSSEPAAPAEPAVTRTLSERLFAPTIAYMINYPNSGAKDAAERGCAAKSSDPAAKAACMDKERSKFVADVLVFEKTDKGASLTIYKRAGNSLAEVSRSKIEFTDDGPERMRVKILSDKGWRPLFAGKKALDVTANSESSVEVEDPQLGKLVYEAKIGLLGPSP